MDARGTGVMSLIALILSRSSKKCFGISPVARTWKAGRHGTCGEVFCKCLLLKFRKFKVVDDKNVGGLAKLFPPHILLFMLPHP